MGLVQHADPGSRRLLPLFGQGAKPLVDLGLHPPPLPNGPTALTSLILGNICGPTLLPHLVEKTGKGHLGAGTKPMISGRRNHHDCQGQAGRRSGLVIPRLAVDRKPTTGVHRQPDAPAWRPQDYGDQRPNVVGRPSPSSATHRLPQITGVASRTHHRRHVHAGRPPSSLDYSGVGARHAQAHALPSKLRLECKNRSTPRHHGNFASSPWNTPPTVAGHVHHHRQLPRHHA